MNELMKKNATSMPDILEAGLKKLSSNSQAGYLTAWNEFLKCVDSDVRDLKGSDVLCYVKALENRELKQTSINYKLQAIQRILELYVMAGLIKRNVIKDLRKLGKITSRSQKQVSINLTLLDIQKATEKRNKTALIIKTLANTGLRISELINIKTKNIRPEIVKGVEYKRVYILGKGKKERNIYIPDMLYQKIIKVFNADSEYLFNSRTGKKLHRGNLYNQINSRFYKATGKNISCHALRHFYATYKIKTERKTVKAVSIYLGHSSTAITQDMYLHDSQSADEAIIKDLL